MFFALNTIYQFLTFYKGYYNTNAVSFEVRAAVFYNITMFKEARKAQLLSVIKEKTYTSSTELCRHFGLSAMTVHRLLKELQEEKKIHKFHGGVSAAPDDPRVPDAQVGRHEQYFEEKRERGLPAKQAIARYAAHTFLKPEYTYFFEAGSTVHEMIPFIRDDSITIITHGLHIVRAALTRHPSLSVICVGGAVRARSMSAVGTAALRFLEDFHAEVFFMSAQALSVKGIMDPDPFESSIKRSMMERSRRIVLLADDSKMNCLAAELVAPLSAVHDVVTNGKPPADIQRFLAKHGINLHIAPPLAADVPRGTAGESRKQSSSKIR